MSVSRLSLRRSAGLAYLAGPTVFLPDALEQGAKLKAICAECGLVGVFPLDDLEPSKTPTSKQIFEHNLHRLQVCDVVIADMSPFRGPHADDGTAFEMGFANALLKPIFGYSSDPRPLNQRISVARDSTLRLRDRDGIEVEDFGLPQNLMLSCALAGFYISAQQAIHAAALIVDKSK